ncbi:MAG TPA: hypothetical protein VL551_07790 [Actinospica sp.]|nr:hypothetical protein [Actinospica sp.]
MDLVTDLGLSQDRRDQLIAWLEDETLLRGEFPSVADYFAAAARMPDAFGDPEALAFDVRLLHYATAGLNASANPYWEIVAPSVSERGGRRLVNGGKTAGSAQLALAQMSLQSAYAYAIPSPETIEWVSGVCGGRSMVEIGAGRGYWAAQLSRAGLRIDAYDVQPPDAIGNVSFPHAAGQRDVWHPVSGRDAFADQDRSQDVLLLCWPPGWGNTMASDTLATFERVGGARLVYIGEPKGGKTGDDAFFDALAARWKLESTDSQFVSWWNLADQAQCWVRD